MNLTNKLTVSLRQFIEYYLIIQRTGFTRNEAYVLSFIIMSHPKALDMTDELRDEVLASTKMKSSYLSQLLKKLTDKGIIGRMDRGVYFLQSSALKQISDKLIPKITDKISLTYEFTIQEDKR